MKHVGQTTNECVFYMAYTRVRYRNPMIGYIPTSYIRSAIYAKYVLCLCKYCSYKFFFYFKISVKYLLLTFRLTLAQSISLINILLRRQENHTLYFTNSSYWTFVIVHNDRCIYITCI